MLVGLYVLTPKISSAPYRVVIAPHGHVSGGKASAAGRRDIPELAETIEAHNYDYGVQLVREGFIVFCPDARGQGERQEADNEGNILKASCLWFNNMGMPQGQTVTGMWTWDLHRLIDYIETRDDCMSGRIGRFQLNCGRFWPQTARIRARNAAERGYGIIENAVGCAGLSGGGLQTLWAAALDERIRCAVVSGYMYGFKESLLDINCCQCNFVPHLYEYVDMGDIAALIAPRPLVIETGARDGLNGASGLGTVRPQVNTIKKAYRALGTPKMLVHDIFEGPHRWNGVKAIPWLKKHLMG